MAESHPLSGSPEDMELPTIHTSSADAHSEQNGAQQPPLDLNRLQLKLAEAETVHAGLLKDYQALLEAKAKKDAELANLLDDNENLMNTISTINMDNKERVRGKQNPLVLALKNENEGLKAKLKELEAAKSGSAGISETKKVDSLFGSLFGSKPTPAPSAPDGSELKRYQDEVAKLKHDAETLKTEHGKQIKLIMDDREKLSSKFEDMVKEKKSLEADLADSRAVAAGDASKLADVEAQLEVTKSQMEAFKIELSSRPAAPAQQDIDAVLAPVKEAHAALEQEHSATIKSFEEFRASSAQELATQRQTAEQSHTLLEKQLSERRVEVETLLGEKAALQIKLDEQRAQLLAEMAAAADKDNTEFVAFRKQLDEALKAKEEAVASLAQLESEKRALESSTSTAHAALQEKLTQVEADLENTRAQLATSTAEASSASTDFSTRVAQIEAELAAKLKELASLTMQVQEAHLERDTLRAQKESSEEAFKKNETEYATRLTAATASVAELEKTKASLEEQVDKVTKEKAAKVKKSKALNTKLAKATEDLEKADADLKQLQATLATSTATISKLEAEVAEQAKVAASTSQDRDSLLARLTDFKMKADHVAERLVSVEHERDDLKKFQDLYEAETLAHASAQSLVDSTKGELKSVEDALQEALKKLAEAQTELASVQSTSATELTALRTELDGCKQEIPRLEFRANSLKEQLDKEKAKAKDLERDLGLEKDHTLQLTTSKKELTETLEQTTQRLTSDLETARSAAESQIQGLQSKLDETTKSLEETSSTLSKTSGELETLQTQHTAVSEEKESLATQLAEHQGSLETLRSESEQRIATLEQQLEDKDMEAKIAERQNLGTIQQLKTQLKALEEKPPVAKSSGHQKTLSIGSSGGAAGASRTKLAASQPALAHSASLQSAAVSSSSAASTTTPKRNLAAAGSKPSTPASSSSGTAADHDILPTDIEALSRRIGELTQQNFMLHDQIKTAEEAKRKVEKESRLKSQWIRQHAIKLKGAVPDSPSAASSSTPASSSSSSSSSAASSSTPNQKAQKGTPKRTAPPEETGFFSSLFSSPARSQPAEPSQAQQSMASVLEETLLKNMQLQEDLKLIATDIETLQKQNQLLMSTLVTNSIEVPIFEQKSPVP